MIVRGSRQASFVSGGEIGCRFCGQYGEKSQKMGHYRVSRVGLLADACWAALPRRRPETVREAVTGDGTAGHDAEARRPSIEELERRGTLCARVAAI